MGVRVGVMAEEGWGVSALCRKSSWSRARGEKSDPWSWGKGSRTGLRRERDPGPARREKGIDSHSTGKKWNPSFNPWFQALHFLGESDSECSGLWEHGRSTVSSLQDTGGGVAHIS